MNEAYEICGRSFQSQEWDYSYQTSSFEKAIEKLKFACQEYDIVAFRQHRREVQ